MFKRDYEAGPRRIAALALVFLFIFGLSSRLVQAQGPTGTVEVTKAIQGNPTSVNSGTEFTYVINYKYASTTADGVNVVLTDQLDTDLSWNSAQVIAGTTVHIASTNFNPATGLFTYTFVDPLPAGSSGQLTLRVRFPNGSTPNGTVATNTATMDADNADPATSNQVSITANASCGWTTDITGPSAPIIGTSVTYRASIVGPSTGNLSAISPSTMSMTLPVGVLPGDITNLNGGTTTGTGTTGDPVIVTWTIPNNTSATYNRDVVFSYNPARFTTGQVVGLSEQTSLTVLGGTACGGTDTLTSTITAFTPTPNGSLDKAAPDTTVIPGTQSFYFTLDAASTGNVGLDNFIISDELPKNFALESIRLPVVTNGPGGNFINLIYRRSDTGATEYTWPGSPFASGATVLPVGDLSLPAGVYISYVRFEMGTVASNFNISDNIRLNGRLLTSGWDSPPTMLAVGGQVCNTMRLTADYNGAAAFAAKTDQLCVTAIDPTVRPAVAKSVISGGSGIPGLITKWQVEVSNNTASDIPMVNPVGMDLLPATLEYVAGSFVSRTDSTYNSSGAPAPTLEVIPDFNGSGRTLLRWTYAHSFPINTRSTVQFETRVKSGAAAGTISNLANVSVVPAQQSGPVVYITPVTDSNDLNGNSSTTDQIGQSGAANITYNSSASLDSYKLVKGQLDTEYTKFPDIGRTSPGGTADYRLVVINTGNIPLRDVVVIDILPVVGDTAVTSTTPRETEFTLLLAGPVAAPSGVTVEYSLESDPCRDQMGDPDPFPAGCVAPNWTSVPPVDITTVRSLRFNFGTLILGPGDEFELNWPMRVPVSAPFNGEVAWNSFGVIATRNDTNSPLLPTEPIKVGIQSDPPQPAAYGDRVWNDLNRDGIQDANEPGINGVRVELYHDNGDGISDPATDELVGFTITTGGGDYLFTNLPVGDYFAAFFEPPTFLVSPANVGGDDEVDSDGTAGTVRGFAATITPVTTLVLGEIDPSWDQGFYQPEQPVAAVGNYVWNDLNNNGLQDEPSSAGLNGITVNLYNLQGGLQGTTVTANDINGNPGYYLFDNLVPGDYFVEFVLPSGFTFTLRGPTGNSDANDSDPADFNGRTETFSLAGGQYDPTWDAGMVLPEGNLSLGDRVWNDANRNGIYEPGLGEVGINQVRLNLYQDTDGSGDFTPGVDQFFATTTTFTEAGVPGYYEFENLPAGNYIVQVDPLNFIAGGPLDGLISSLGNTPAPDPDNNVNNDDNGQPLPGYGVVSLAITLSAGDEPAGGGNHNPTLDFGFMLPAGTIGDTLWYDYNGDGDQDAGEPGIPGITVSLTPPPGVDLGNGPDVPVTDITDGNGKYLFENLPAGDYTVTVTNPPAGFANTGDPDGGANSTSDLTLPLGGEDLDQDFGYQPDGTIGDTIWYDNNGDGDQDPGESGIPGITVQLTPPAGIDLGNGPGVPVTDVTDGDGNYLFTDLPPGDYTVTVTNPPAGFVNTGDPDGGFDDTSDLTLPLGGDDLDQDFGYQPLGTIGDTVWYDYNGDGDQDAGEPGIPGITVSLTPPAGVDLGNGPGVAVTDTTDGTGKYLFENLPDGDYTVTVTNPPAGMANTGDPDGGFDDTSDLTLPLGGDDLDQDFGYQPNGTIGDTVWYDVNGDGVLDPGEPGIPGITVSLTPPAGIDLGNGPGVAITDVTDANGVYLFEDLPPGAYTVAVVTPPVGLDNTGDPDGVFDGTSDLTLPLGGSNLIQDFGYQPDGTIGDTIFYDYFGDGAMDGADTGIPGITVKLEADYDGDGTIDQTFTDVTDANGKYLFENLPPGEYRVTVTNPPAGYINTADPDGGFNDLSDLVLGLGEDNLLQDFGYQPPSFCPIGDAVYKKTDILGLGMGSDNKHMLTSKIIIPNWTRVTELYGQLAGKYNGGVKYVRFIYPNNKYVQIKDITGYPSQLFGVFTYETELIPSATIRGRWFLHTTGAKNHVPRALITYPTYRMDEEYVNLFELVQPSDSQVYWNIANGWTPYRRLAFDLPAPQGPSTLTVKVALVDNDLDRRPVYVTVTAGGVAERQVLLSPNRKTELNIAEFTLPNVPVGTDELIIELESPQPYTDGLTAAGGDSVAIVGMTAHYACTP